MEYYIYFQYCQYPYYGNKCFSFTLKFMILHHLFSKLLQNHQFQKTHKIQYIYIPLALKENRKTE